MKKGSCFVSDCGPVVMAGFHLSQYPVCQKCKEEVTEPLARAIRDAQARDDKWREVYVPICDDDIDLALHEQGKFTFIEHQYSFDL